MIDKIEKRDKRVVDYNRDKIRKAIKKAGRSVEDKYRVSDEDMEDIIEEIEYRLHELDVDIPSVETIQDEVEDVLLDFDYNKLVKEYILYRAERSKKREEGWFKDNLAVSIWERKYRYDGESVDEFLDRVSGDNLDIKKMIKNREFIPAGRILANRKLNELDDRKITYSNCYTSIPPEDNLESIFEISKKLARTFSYGGGEGVDVSKLRPKGSEVNNAAKETTGAVSFMRIYNLTTDIIGQAGRRGALLISMIVNHPDIEEFIESKLDLNKLNKTNISVRVTDDFMKAVRDGKDFKLYFEVEDTGEVIEKKVNADRIFNKIAYGNWYSGEPGVLFWDRIKSWNMLDKDEEYISELTTTNPCGYSVK